MTSPSEYYDLDETPLVKEPPIRKTTNNNKSLKNTSLDKVINLEDKIQNSVKHKTTVKINNNKYDDLLGQIIHQQHSIIITLNKLTKKISKIEKYIIFSPLIEKTYNSIKFNKIKEEYKHVLSSISKIVKKNV